MNIEQTENTAQVEMEICATCSAACPVHTSTREYVDLIAQGKYEQAFEKIREFNPFPTVCGLICHHPCEEACRRQNVDESVALRNLKRFAVEQALEYRKRLRKKAEITKDQTVGVLGAGPAGLTVASDCIKQGYAVTVYEALPRAGGMLACAIPKYRLPDEALQADIDDILALGIEVKTGMRVGKDITLDELKKKHDALVVAYGLSDSRSIPIENKDHQNVLLAIPFLRSAALGEPVEVKENVIVIGGGNVAVDVARTAARLGAKTVKMVCLENEEEIPAWDWECREALEEGISIIYRQGPTKVVVEKGEIKGLVTREVERVFDEEGRFSPTYFDDRLTTIEGQMVIITIGQMSDLGSLEGTDVKQDERGRLVFNASQMSTSDEGVFACGEVVTGPGSAIEAVASGHRAAKAVMGYLQTGGLQTITDEEVEEVGELPEDVIENVRRIQRLAMPTMSPEERKKSFAQFEFGYDEKQALQEARRCLACTGGAIVDEKKCESCLTCLRVCPFGVPAVDDVAVMTSDMCQACGLCAVECPAAAISIKRFSIGDVEDRVVALVNGSKKPVTKVEFICSQDAGSGQELQDRIEVLDGDVIAKLPVTCAARVTEVDMMKPFELGSDSVHVQQCKECRYRGADDRLFKRVERTRSILNAAGIDGNKLTVE